MKVLITTTIHVPEVLRQYRRGMNEDDVILVAGDLKSPHEDIVEFLKTMSGTNRYIPPNEQDRWRSSEVIGWNCIQRRNIALLEAIEMKPEIIATVDDDNFPHDPVTYWSDVEAAFKENAKWVVRPGDDRWWNAGSLLEPQVTHRGFPYSQRPGRQHIGWEKEGWRYPVGVVAGLWTGDPDIDAMERLVNRPDVHAVNELARDGVVLPRGVWCPFNSQNTSYLGALGALMMCWPGVGRFDDIFASYLATAVMHNGGRFVRFGKPFVRQDRNEHDLWQDLEDEYFGYRHTDEIVDALRTASYKAKETPSQHMQTAYDAVILTGVLPEQTMRSFDMWWEDLGDALR